MSQKWRNWDKNEKLILSITTGNRQTNDKLGTVASVCQ